MSTGTGTPREVHRGWRGYHCVGRKMTRLLAGGRLLDRKNRPSVALPHQRRAYAEKQCDRLLKLNKDASA